MSSQPYSPQGQEIQLDITSYTAAQPTSGNPSQSLNFLPYEPNSLSPTVSYTESSHGYGGRLDFSNASSPVHSHRPVPSPLLQSTFFAPSHPETISPTALYQHQASSGTFTADSHGGRHRSYSHPHPHPRAASQSQSQSQSHAREIFRTESPAPHPSYHQHSLSQDYLLPDPHATRPQLSISVSSGVVGHSEGWSDSTVPLSDTPDRLPTDPTPSPRSRATSLMGKKKKASPRTGVVPLPARKRSPASCAPCRKKKLKCDRSLPCSSCVAKGTECIWQGDATPLYIKDEHDQRGTKELQAQVDRLQALVDDLASSPKSSKTSFKLDSTTGSEVHSLDPSPTFELLAHDLAQGLVEVAFEGVLPQQQSAELSFSPDGRSGAAFIDEARHFSKSRSRPTPLTSLVTPSTSSSEGSPSSSGFPPLRNFALPALQSSYSRGRQSVTGLLESVPAFNDIDIASNHFFGTVDLLVPLVIRSKFEQARDALRRAVEDKSDLGPIPIALVLAVASAGLSKMTELEALERGMAGDRKAMVGKWLDLAVSALSLARFPESPTFDGIRTALIVASLQLTGNYGDDVRAYPSAISLLSSAAQAAFALELHREPNRNGRTKYRFSECQERRRLFWGLFAVCSSVTTDTCRPWPQFDLRYIDTHFPLDCFDEELSMDELAIRASVRARVNSETFEETPMTFNLCLARLAFVSKKISDEAFAVGGCHHPKIAVLFSELRKFEESLPECYRVPFDQEERASFSPRSSLATNLKAALVQASISSEIVRLNRPFLVLAASDEKYHRSRERAVTHAKRVLSIATDPSCQRIVPELLPKTLSAAIVVGIELIQAPEEFDVKLLQALFKASSELMAQYSRTSIIAAQGANVLRFLHKHMSVSASSSASGYRAKWPRSSRDVPHEGTLQPRQTWLHSVPNSMYPSRAGSPGSDSEVLLVSRKANRPALKHSARSESHLSSRARFVPRPLLPERSHRSHSAEDFPSFTTPTLPLSPTTTSTSAPSIAAFSPILDSEASRYSHHQPSRDRTFSGPASSLHLTDLSVGAFPAQSTVFRYYQHPSGSNRASFSANPGPPDSGLGIIDFAHHGNHPLPTSPAYEEDDPFQPHVGERMETEDLRFEHSVVEDYAFASTYRHS